MGRMRGPYEAEFREGVVVRVKDRALLEHFRSTWRYHHPLDVEQLSYAGSAAEVETVSYYHGGDAVYTLEGIPGVWHEQCLEAAV